jgi:hypothetical protein
LSNPYGSPGASDAPGAAPMGAVEIRTSFFPLAFLLYLFPAKATIDGSGDIAHGWGTRLYPLPPGRHQVRVWCPYLGMMKLGDAVHEIDVAPGQVTGVQWTCPWLIFLNGSWRTLGMRPLGPGELVAHAPAAPAAPAVPVAPAAAVAPTPPAGGPPPGWHPDPSGQAAQRYWDGHQWTEHVSG